MAVETRFEEIGARVKVRARPGFSGGRMTRSILSATPFARTMNFPLLDVRRDRKGEYFDLAVPEGVEMEVIDADRSSRHLLLLARMDAGRDKARYLCGHDERHWFVAAVPESYPASTVAEAKVALQPPAIRDLAAALPKGKRTARHNVVYHRQGEWFFLPAPDFEPLPNDILLRNEPLSRGRGSTPHVVAEMVRSGGETRYQASRASTVMMMSDRATEIRAALNDRTLTAAEKRVMEARFPEVAWVSVLVNPTVYVRGPVRHSDHATLDLKGWHRVVMSAENLARAASHVVFVD